MLRLRGPCAGLVAPVALCALFAGTAWGAPPGIDALLQAIRRAPPASTPFVEAHFSRLLTRPLVVSGTLEYLGPDALARTVERPYHERTEIRGDNVKVERQGERARTFSLQRAPELKSLLSSFAALLAGDRASLEQQFQIEVHGLTARWRLELTPRDARVRSRVAEITMTGGQSEPRCLETVQPGDELTIMLLAHAAEASVPPAADRAWFEAQCRGTTR